MITLPESEPANWRCTCFAIKSLGSLSIWLLSQLRTLRTCAYAGQREWHNLRLLRTGEGSTFKIRSRQRRPRGNQHSTISVQRCGRHAAPVPHRAPSNGFEYQRTRHRPDDAGLQNALDLAPQGRGDWYAKLDYGPPSTKRSVKVMPISSGCFSGS